MNYLNPDIYSGSRNIGSNMSHSGSMQTTVRKLDKQPLTYVELRIRCDLLECEAEIHNKAMAVMSKEICELNEQLVDMLDQLKEMQ